MPGARVTSEGSVSLRTLESEDLAFYQRVFANEAIRIPIGNPVVPREELSAEGEDGSDRLLVCLDGEKAGPGQPREGQFDRLGVVSVDDVDYRRPEFGYWLAEEYHGQGYGTEAVGLAIDYVFRTYDHPAVGAKAYEFNEASRGLLESLGFEEEGRVRRDRFIDGEYVDTVVYGLLREDWSHGSATNDQRE